MRFFGQWILLALGLIASATSFAAPSTSIMSAEERAALVNPWDFSVSFAHYESLYNEEDGSRTSSNLMTNTLSYKINRDFKISAELDLANDSLHPVDSDSEYLAGASLRLEHSEFKMADHLLLVTPSLSTDIPVSQYDHHVTLQSSLGAGLKIALNPRFLISKRLSVSTTLSGKRYFNTYSEAMDGTPNAEYSSSQGLNLGWEFTPWLAFAASGSHYNFWSYQGEMQEYYGHSEEFNFTMNKMWQLAIGHSYGNPMMPFVPVWKADGDNTNFSLLSEQYSTVYAQVTVNF